MHLNLSHIGKPEESQKADKSQKQQKERNDNSTVTITLSLLSYPEGFCPVAFMSAAAWDGGTRGSRASLRRSACFITWPERDGFEREKMLASPGNNRPRGTLCFRDALSVTAASHDPGPGQTQLVVADT